VRYDGLCPTAKFIWARLARFCGENGQAFPSIRILAEQLGLSHRQVQRGLAALEGQHFIRRVFRKTNKGDFTSTIYVFLLHPIFLEALRACESKANPASNSAVVTETSPGGERVVTTKIKRRLEEKTSSSPEVCNRTPPPPTPSSKFRDRPKSAVTNVDDDHPTWQKNSPYKGDRDELIALIQASVGQPPDRRLIRDIVEGLELRNISLREYLEDIHPRLCRLKHPPGFGFFRHHLTAWHDGKRALPSASAEKPVSPCPSCSGTGRRANKYCDCAMGRDLEQVEKRIARMAAAREARK
jgi:hypothetical protein